MERLLQYAWRYKILPLTPLHTTDGEEVEVLDPGTLNRDAGPDFFCAKLKIGGMVWAGHVEVHAKSSDWYRHGHQADKAYDHVVLHVVGKADCRVTRPDGRPIPQVELPLPPGMAERYDELRRAEFHPPCYSVLDRLPRFILHSWLNALQVERCERKADDIRRRLQLYDHNWEDTFFATLARNFGFSINSDAFEAWAQRIPFRAVDKHRDNLFQVEAFFFGQAGLLEIAPEPTDPYFQQLQGEFHYLQHKFSMPEPLPPERWRLLRLRPNNFPYVRLAQLAHLYHSRQSLVSRMMEATDVPALKELLSTDTSTYWETHYAFGHASPKREKHMGQKSLELLIINTVVPFLYAYGSYKHIDAMLERAGRLLEGLQPESNHITRMWGQSGVEPANAADSQALIQLQKEYCDKRYCLRCRIGYEFLKGRRAKG